MKAAAATATKMEKRTGGAVGQRVVERLSTIWVIAGEPMHSRRQLQRRIIFKWKIVSVGTTPSNQTLSSSSLSEKKRKVFDLNNHIVDALDEDRRVENTHCSAQSCLLSKKNWNKPQLALCEEGLFTMPTLCSARAVRRRYHSYKNTNFHPETKQKSWPKRRLLPS